MDVYWKRQHLGESKELLSPGQNRPKKPARVRANARRIARKACTSEYGEKDNRHLQADLEEKEQLHQVPG